MIDTLKKTKTNNLFLIIGMLCLIGAFVLSLFDKGFGKTLWLMSQITLLMLIGVLFLYFSKRNTIVNLKFNKFLSVYFALYLLWLLIAPYFSTWYDLSRLTAWGLALTPLFFYLGSIFDLSSQLKKICIYSYLLIGLVLFVWADLHFIVTQERPSGPLIDTNVFAGLLLFFLLPVCVYLLTARKDLTKKNNFNDYLYIYLIFGFLAFFSTLSRSAFLAFLIVSMLLLARILYEYKLLVLKKCLVIISIVGFSYLAVNYHYSDDNKPGFTNLSQDRSTQVRFEIWKTSLEIIKKKPIVGQGFGQFKAVYKRFRTPADDISSGDYAHNDYIQFLLEGGVIQLFFFTILSFYIIYLYAKLFLTKKKATENEKNKNLLLLAFLSTVCVFFIQANANFIFYLLPNSILIGLLLGYVTSNMPLDNFKFNLTKKVAFLIALIALFSVGTLFVDTYIQQNYLQVKSELNEGDLNEQFKKSELLMRLRPRSLALARYQFVSYVQNFENNNNIQLVDQSYSKLNKVNPNDAFSLHYLGRFAEKYPDNYQKLQEITDNSKLYLSYENLYLKSIDRDPSLIISYYRLHKIYHESNHQEKAYRLFREKLYPRFDYGELGLLNELKIAETMMNDAVDLGYKNDAEEFANQILKFNNCHENANLVIKASVAKSCDAKKTIMF